MNAPTTTTNLTLEATRQRLRQLGLYGLLAQVEALMHEPWFTRVLEIEDAERARRSLKRRLDDTRLGAFKPIADFDWAWPQKCDRSLIEELFSLAFIEEAANVVLIGANVLGKTMLLKNLAHQAVLPQPADQPRDGPGLVQHRDDDGDLGRQSVSIDHCSGGSTRLT